jgi:methylated-DNA-[protein]-cysteine S-methyltransferase
MQDTGIQEPFAEVLWLTAGVCARIERTETGIRQVEIHRLEKRPAGESLAIRSTDDPLLKEAASQVAAYFDGRLREFKLPLDLRGTEFQRRVWGLLLSIPYGETRTYAQIAVAAGNPAGTRAVGAANGRNPVPIIVPCHRVVQTGGGLGGYSGGLDIKRALLALEQGAAASLLAFPPVS